MSGDLAPLPETYASTRDAVHRVAVHVLARRRHRLCGRFGLRALPGGIGTPACGPEHEVVRTSGTWLVRERTGAQARTTGIDLAACSLADAAVFAEVDLGEAFSAGHDTPPVGDPASRLGVDAAGARCLAAWFGFGALLLDSVAPRAGPGAEATVAQLWPEHFDIGLDLAVAPGRRVNLGASPGDAHHAAPYVYVGPWGPGDRPGDPAFWNAPFGAVVGYDELRSAPDPLLAGTHFLARGLELLGG